MVAMSGGVDSSVAASLLQVQGHEVTGVTLKLWGGPSDSGCCSVEDVEDARQVAAQLGVDHHVFNMADEFEAKVVAPYVADHLEGRTPNPCIECNRHLKFDALLVAARRLGFEALATGHHARITRDPGGPSLRRGLDQAKDQSYVLSMLTSAQLDSIVLPVGEMTKSDVRDHALRRGLRTSRKAESQDVCFIESGAGRRGFLSQRATLTPGEVIEASTGRVVGAVDAVELVTVGQRKGFGLDDEGRRRVVIGVRPDRGAVMVAPPEESERTELVLDPDSATWVDEVPEPGAALLVQVRAHGQAVACTWESTQVTFGSGISPVAPGQTAAFYDPEDPDRVVGSVRVSG